MRTLAIAISVLFLAAPAAAVDLYLCSNAKGKVKATTVPPKKCKGTLDVLNTDNVVTRDEFDQVIDAVTLALELLSIHEADIVEFIVPAITSPGIHGCAPGGPEFPALCARFETQAAQ